ncbi:sialate O-acetylesterase [Saccharicrinis carchari]|uniref:Sialate O-acetylesterase n=2 Tax=Saccharicrinis carchari TaxID=1168039 RepID=A0A521DMP2_SACCC|nr:sialate O-acetylesterase [Saccharicrinis carchari]
MVSFYCCCSITLGAQQYKSLMNLEGQWKFSLGNKPEWAKPGFDHSAWEEIDVPSPWETQGFNGYNGYAWYRKFITLSAKHKEEKLVLELGYIDDVDEVFFNGERIGGSGQFPPDFATAYTARRMYPIPDRLIRYNSANLIAVKVFDQQLEGGIVRGEVRLLSEKNPLKTFLDLQGEWGFRIGDNIDWRYESDDADGWGSIYVPGAWENQGYKRYDGYAWYQKTFMANSNFNLDRVVLLVGKIDDLDEVFVNGVKVGQTGFMEPEREQHQYSLAYQQLRGYLIPQGLIHPDKKNTIHVRVSDFYQEGGIVEGPVGFIKQEDYIRYWRNKKMDR